MKIYFDGCSWTWGGELEPDTRLNERYSRLVCDKLGAEEWNYATPGSSNDRIVRQLMENDISQYDLAVIQLTYPTRSEFYMFNTWKKMGIMSQYKKRNNSWFWNHYYKQIYNDHYGSIKEKLSSIIVQDHCKAHGVPVILNKVTDLERSPYITRAKGGHPNAQGHRMIAKEILDRI